METSGLSWSALKELLQIVILPALAWLFASWVALGKRITAASDRMSVVERDLAVLTTMLKEREKLSIERESSQKLRLEQFVDEANKDRAQMMSVMTRIEASIEKLADRLTSVERGRGEH